MPPRKGNRGRPKKFEHAVTLSDDPSCTITKATSESWHDHQTIQLNLDPGFNRSIPPHWISMAARICLLLAFALTLLPASTLLAHDSPNHDPTTTIAKTIDARGIVFDDRNGNRKRDDGEPGLANIRVSNGKDITQTDEKGKYELQIDEDDIIFVIKPRDWVTPLDEDNLPQFYYIHKPAGSPATFKFPGVDPTGPLPKSIDFPLRHRPEPETFKAIMFGDPQPRDITEVEYIAHDVIEQIVAEQAHGAAFGVTLGDIVFDDLSVMAPLNQAIALIGIPWYNVIGNHDLNLEAKVEARVTKRSSGFTGQRTTPSITGRPTSWCSTT